ncbi:MAG TPA: LamG domain-containing protein [Candidatus Nanoarchaeia archaeon]|nr:LamG domain-containing protein [Candidatus Nanoarchaeia archaeon]
MKKFLIILSLILLSIFAVACTSQSDNSTGKVVGVNTGVVNMPSCISPPSGMIGWWTGDNVYFSKVSALETSYFINSPGAPNAYVAGIVGNALKFIGGPNRLSITVNPANQLILPNTAGRTSNVLGFTADTWVKLDKLPGSNDYYSIITKWDENINERSFALTVNNNGALRFDTSPDGKYHANNAVYSTSSLLLDTWYHVAVTTDGANNKIYLNGQNVATKTITNAADRGLIILNDTTNIYLGHSPKFMDGSRDLYGILDEVEIFNRALSQSEIQSIYNAGSAGKCKN